MTQSAKGGKTAAADAASEGLVYSLNMSLFKSLKSLGPRAKHNIGADEPSMGVNGMPFWMEKIKHQGISPFHPDPQYRVFRNVKVHCFL